MLLTLYLAQILLSVSLLCNTCWSFDHANQTVSQLIEPTTESDNRHPIYLIAHRVLHTGAITQALSDGANAFEMDVAPHKGILYAFHDDPMSDFTGRNKPGDTVKAMFDRVVELRNTGSNLSFVWLDIKKPGTWSGGDTECSIRNLQRMARDTLGQVGVAVMYGFSQRDTALPAFTSLAKSLNRNEAIDINGRASAVKNIFTSAEIKTVPAKQRVMDFGVSFLNLPKAMDCDYPSKLHSFGGICYELHKAARLRDRQEPRKPILGKVFGWTLRVQDKMTTVEKLLGFAKADGLIYGEATHDYRNHKDNRAAIQRIKDWLQKNHKTHRAAGQEDRLWS